jgi:hypothetical protein
VSTATVKVAVVSVPMVVRVSDVVIDVIPVLDGRLVLAVALDRGAGVRMPAVHLDLDRRFRNFRTVLPGLLERSVR